LEDGGPERYARWGEQHYYLKQGFTYVRTVVLPHNPSGALFQRPVQRIPTPRLEKAESLTG
jgi:hypothetical protein